MLTSPGNQTNAAGDDVSLSAGRAAMPMATRLTYTASGLPPGLTLDPLAGTISGTLPNSAASSTPYNVTVTASDGMASSSQSFTWTVNAVGLTNPGDQSNLDGDAVSLPTDGHGRQQWHAHLQRHGLAAGPEHQQHYGLISGTISNTADNSTPYAVTVTATDGTNSASQSFNWTRGASWP